MYVPFLKIEVSFLNQLFTHCISENNLITCQLYITWVASDAYLYIPILPSHNTWLASVSIFFCLQGWCQRRNFVLIIEVSILLFPLNWAGKCYYLNLGLVLILGPHTYWYWYALTNIGMLCAYVCTRSSNCSQEVNQGTWSAHATYEFWLITVHFFVMQMSHHMSFLLVEMLSPLLHLLQTVRFKCKCSQTDILV